MYKALLRSIPGKPVAHNHGLPSINYGLLGGIVACYLELLGLPGSFFYRCKRCVETFWNTSAGTPKFSLDYHSNCTIWGPYVEGRGG